MIVGIRRAVQQAPNSKRFETKRKDSGRSFVSQAIDETVAEYKQKIKVRSLGL